MRILMITQWFDPEPTLKGLAFAKSLAQRGHSVEVITGFPNYPGGDLYPGYRIRPIQRETFDEVSVIRVPLYPSHDGSVIRRAANYITFAVSATVAGLTVARHADVAYVYHPPGTIGIPAIAVRLFRRIPLVLDVQDLWPDTLAATGMTKGRILLSLVSAGMRLLYRVATKISVLSPGFKHALTQRGVPSDKVSVIRNWAPSAPDERPLRPEIAAILDGKFNIVYAGAMGPAQDLHSVLAAAELGAQHDENIQFVLVGDGVDAADLRRESEQRGIRNVVILPRMGLDEIGGLLTAADGLLVHLRNDPLFEITIPSKTQAYLSAGRPIVMAVGGDGGDLVDSAGAGIRCEPGSPSSIAQGVQHLRQMEPDERDAMGERGQRFYAEHLAFQVGVDQFERLMHQACRRDSVPAGLKS